MVALNLRKLKMKGLGFSNLGSSRMHYSKETRKKSREEKL